MYVYVYGQMFIFILECFVTKQCWSTVHCQSVEHLPHFAFSRPAVRQALLRTLLRAILSPNWSGISERAVNLFRGCMYLRWFDSRDNVRSFIILSFVPLFELAPHSKKWLFSQHRAIVWHFLLLWTSVSLVPIYYRSQKFACKFFKLFMVQEETMYMEILRKNIQFQV